MMASFNCGSLLRELRLVDRDACGIDHLRFRQIERFLGHVPKQESVQCTPEEIDFIMSLPRKASPDA